ncbi:hypothetical protein JCM15831A_23680 [Asaia astilbis]
MLSHPLQMQREKRTALHAREIVNLHIHVASASQSLQATYSLSTAFLTKAPSPLANPVDRYEEY